MDGQPGHWSDVDVAGHRCRAFTPSEPTPHGFAVLYLHDVDASGLESSSAFTRQFELHGLRCLAPISGRSWWTDRQWPSFDAESSTERYLLERVLPWLADCWQVRPTQLALLGVGMGGQGALKFSYKHPNLFPVCAAVSPTIDYHTAMEAGDATLRQLYRDSEQARQDTATLHIHPLNWPRHQWFCCNRADDLRHDGADRLRMKLYSLGVPHECDLETLVEQPQEYLAQMAEPALRFIAERLQRERLRV